MKRSLAGDDVPVAGEDKKMKKIKVEDDEDEENEKGFMQLDENLLYEVLKHADARTLATAACVSKQWHKTAHDERLWELICTRGCGNQRLRSVVLALGGFRSLHSVCPPSLKPSVSSSSSASSSSSSSSVSSPSPWASTSLSSPVAPMIASKPPTWWGKDEVNLSLSLLSIRYFERMNLSNRGR